jgi:hypothetical protein
VLVPSLARADERTSARSSAEELFQQGKAAMLKKDFPRACNLLADSLRAEDTLGTLLNLAICHEESGKVASAWGEFRAVEQRALAANPPQVPRAEYARQHADALRERLSRLRVVVAEGADVPGIMLRVDGVEQVKSLWDTGIPVDPGKRLVRIDAPGKKPFELEAVVDGEKLTVTLKIPPLDDAPKDVAVPASGGTDVAALDAYAAARARRTTGFVVGGIGIAFLATGAVFGGLAFSAKGDADQCVPNCVDKDLHETAERAYKNAGTYGHVSNIGFALGAIGAGVGAYLVLTSKVGPSKVALVPGLGTLSISGAL